MSQGHRHTSAQRSLSKFKYRKLKGSEIFLGQCGPYISSSAYISRLEHTEAHSESKLLFRRTLLSMAEMDTVICVILEQSRKSSF